MADFRDILKRFHRPPRDITAIDIGSTGAKVVRVRKLNQVPTLVAAAISDVSDTPAGDDGSPLAMSREIRARYAALCVSGFGASVKLLSIPGPAEGVHTQIEGHMGLDSPEQYRIGYHIVARGHGRAETRVLAVALDDAEAAAAPRVVPAGIPAPRSLELAGLAAVSAFLYHPSLPQTDEAVGVLDCGARVSLFSLFSKGSLALVRKFDFGAHAVLQQVERSLGVAPGTAEEIFRQGSFDITEPCRDAMESFIKQLIVSRDFVERRENCRIRRIHMSGGAAVSPSWQKALTHALDMPVEPWNPFECLTVAPQALAPELAAQAPRFAAAVGAALATLEEG